MQEAIFGPAGQGWRQKGNKIPLAGVPYHALDAYLAKLIRAGHKVL